MLSKILEKPVPRQAVERHRKIGESLRSCNGADRTASMNGYGDVTKFVDEYPEYSVVKFMKFRAEAGEMFREYVAEEETPGKLRSDKAKEYKSQHFAQLCLHDQIEGQFSVSETTNWCSWKV